MCFSKFFPASIERGFGVAALSVGLSFLGLPGCANSSAEYQVGQQKMAAGDYDEAVVQLRKALEQNPGNTQCLTQLAEAEMLAADHHVGNAERLLAAGKTAEAQAELKIALSQAPGHPQAIRMMDAMGVPATASPDAVVLAPATPSPATAPAGLADASRSRDRSKRAPVKESTQGGRSREKAKSDAAQPSSASPRKSVAKSSRSRSGEERPGTADAAQPMNQAGKPDTDFGAAPQSTKRSSRTPDETLPSSGPRAVAQPPPAGGIIGTVSRDDKRYPKEIETLDGIIVKVKDTSKRPLSADLEIRVGSFSKRYKHLSTGSRVNGRGLTSRWQIVVITINAVDETVRFAVQPLPDNLPPPP